MAKTANPAATAAATDAAPADAVSSDETDARPGRGKRLVVTLLSAVLLAAGGAGAWWFFGHGAPAGEAGQAPARKSTVFVPLETFTVNLRDPELERYLQVGLVLEASDGAAAEAIKAKMPVIRNRILLLLAAKQTRELVAPEDKIRLAEQIVAEARQPLALPAPARGIDAVHFSSFVIQ